MRWLLGSIGHGSEPTTQTGTASIVVNSTATGKRRYFEFVQGTSSKFWEVSQTANAMMTRWGRIGSNGQSKTKTFVDEKSAASAVAKLIEEKTSEGYVERH